MWRCNLWPLYKSYLQTRYYAPQSGRFINADGYLQTSTNLNATNMYAYCLDNLVNIVDNTGTYPQGFIGPCAGADCTNNRNPRSNIDTVTSKKKVLNRTKSVMKKAENDTFEQDFKVLDNLEKLEILDDSHLSILDSFSSSDNSEIRMRTAQILVFAEPNKAERILLKLADDKDKLVRTNACDSLCICSSEQVMSVLFKKAKTDSFLIKGYAVLSIADVAKNGNFDFNKIYEKLKKLFVKETSPWVKTSYFYSFYKLGYCEYFNSLLDSINSYSYQNRCSAINLLYDIIDENNTSIIEQRLKERLEIEKTYAVISSINKLLENIKRYQA